MVKIMLGHLLKMNAESWFKQKLGLKKLSRKKGKRIFVHL